MNILKKINSFLRAKELHQPTSENNAPAQIRHQIDNEFNMRLFNQLKEHFPPINFEKANGIIKTDNGISIKSYVFNRTEHPNMISMQINFLTVHNVYFPDGIEECLAGFGTDDLTAITNGVESFIGGQFPVILRALTAEQNPAVDFVIKNINGAEEKWHTIIGDLQVQGGWRERQQELEYDKFFSVYRPFFEYRFNKTENNFHWVRAYIAMMPDGNFTGDCFFDNQPWGPGLEALRNYAGSWQLDQTFSGMKQFIMFRKCINHC